MSAPRNHTTHHEDCGCLSALHASEVARLRYLLSEARDELTLTLDWLPDAHVQQSLRDLARRIEEEVGRG